jgi:hypothetical protein
VFGVGLWAVVPEDIFTAPVELNAESPAKVATLAAKLPVRLVVPITAKSLLVVRVTLPEVVSEVPAVYLKVLAVGTEVIVYVPSTPVPEVISTTTELPTNKP